MSSLTNPIAATAKGLHKNKKDEESTECKNPEKDEDDNHSNNVNNQRHEESEVNREKEELILQNTYNYKTIKEFDKSGIEINEKGEMYSNKQKNLEERENRETEENNENKMIVVVDLNEIQSSDSNDDDEQVAEENKQSALNTSADSALNEKYSKKRARWNTKQKELVKSHFKTHIQLKIPPKKAKCMENKNQDILRNLNWVKIKTFIYNTYRLH
ncbi:hypothetical protein FQA39_LY00335 [Lamprigera yunnana]|nr:hypothetical protein FQA39_LY00335 [Lamprigera yunnana]